MVNRRTLLKGALAVLFFPVKTVAGVLEKPAAPKDDYVKCAMFYDHETAQYKMFVNGEEVPDDSGLHELNGTHLRVCCPPPPPGAPPKGVEYWLNGGRV